MDLTTLRVDVADFVATVTIDRPPVNALSNEMIDELTRTFDAFSDRDDVRAVVLTAAGKVFCAGADIKARAGKTFADGERWDYNRAIREMFLVFMECKKPVIAALNGPAIGGGVAMAACCDILLAAENAYMALNEINVGLLGGSRHAMRLFGHSKLRRMMFTGHQVTGPELYRLGVVEACTAPDQLLPTALAMAAEIAEKSPVAIKLGKLAINTIEDLSLRDGYRFEQEMTAQLAGYEDSKEAMRAFLERRKGNFTGR